MCLEKSDMERINQKSKDLSSSSKILVYLLNNVVVLFEVKKKTDYKNPNCKEK